MHAPQDGITVHPFAMLVDHQTARMWAYLRSRTLHLQAIHIKHAFWLYSTVSMSSPSGTPTTRQSSGQGSLSLGGVPPPYPHALNLSRMVSNIFAPPAAQAFGGASTSTAPPAAPAPAAASGGVSGATPAPAAPSGSVSGAIPSHQDLARSFASALRDVLPADYAKRGDRDVPFKMPTHKGNAEDSIRTVAFLNRLEAFLTAKGIDIANMPRRIPQLYGAFPEGSASSVWFDEQLANQPFTDWGEFATRFQRRFCLTKANRTDLQDQYERFVQRPNDSV